MENLRLDVSSHSGKPLIVLFPGMDGTAKLFADFLRVGEKHFRFVVVSYPIDSRSWDSNDYITWIASKLPNESHIALAESFSGPLLLSAIASAEPSSTKAVLLFASLVSPLRMLGFVPQSLLSLCFRIGRIFGLEAFGARLSLLNNWKGSDLSRRLLDAIKELDPATLAARAKILGQVDAREAFSKLSIPSLVVSANSDRVLGRIRLSNHHSQHVGINAPHLVLQTQPDRCVNEILKFIESIKAC